MSNTKISTTHTLEIRSQHSRGGSGTRFGGPDTYVCVQSVPEGVQPLSSLNRKAAKARGITLTYFGEGYSGHTGPRSMLGQAIAEARAYIEAQR